MSRIKQIAAIPFLALFLYTAAAFAGIPFSATHMLHPSPTPHIIGPAEKLIHRTKLDTIDV